MRRLLAVTVLAASSLGLFLLPAGADSSDGSNVLLSFDYSDNSAPASASGGAFNVIVDVLPEHTSGIVRMVAVSPADVDDSNIVCPFQAVQQSQVECAFNFTSNGVWSIKAQYATDRGSGVSSISVTRLRVAN